jgi:hypothetical protein
VAVSDADIRRQILALLTEREPGKTICPSDAARALAQDWRPLLEPVRKVARAMSEVEITQKGEPVDPDTARGPVRLRLRS